MNNKKTFWICILTLAVLAATYNYGLAENKKVNPPGKIAVVSIRGVFNSSKKNADYKVKAKKDQQEMLAKLEKIATEAKGLAAELETLKKGTDDYINLVGQLTEKEAVLKAKQDFYQELLASKDQRWTENLYSQILQVTTELAKEKGLDLVLEKDEVDLPAINSTELLLTIRTHKVLYSSDDFDITDQVTAELDSRK